MGFGAWKAIFMHLIALPGPKSFHSRKTRSEATCCLKSESPQRNGSRGSRMNPYESFGSEMRSLRCVRRGKEVKGSWTEIDLPRNEEKAGEEQGEDRCVAITSVVVADVGGTVVGVFNGEDKAVRRDIKRDNLVVVLTQLLILTTI